MPQTPPLFTLTLDGIYFKDGLPRYPSLVDYRKLWAPDVQLEPSVKSLATPSTGGPFEIVFALDPAQSQRFNTDGSFELKRIDNTQVESPSWSAVVSEAGLVVKLRWDSTDPPPTQVLKLECTTDGRNNPCHLFLSLVEGEPPFARALNSLLPQLLNNPQEFELDGSSGHLVYTIFKQAARDQLAEGFDLEPAFRVPIQTELQFIIELLNTNESFAQSTTGTDQVPVTIYAGETNSAALQPTERLDPKRCLVTWNPCSASGPGKHFLTFNLGTKLPRSASHPILRRRRIDPTIIEDPYLPTASPSKSL